MKLFFDDRQLIHRPQQYMVHGRIVEPFENPERATALVAALEPLGLRRTAPDDFGHDPILDVHAGHYLSFLEEAYARFMELPDHGPEVLPNVHPFGGSGPDLRARDIPRPSGILGQAGWYMGDLSCPIMAGTFRAAYASAQSAIAGAEAVLAGDYAYALCRPPGHHAYQDRASGFCYLNNAAIAAQILRRTFPKVAIIDFDTHHGDGTQAIFYRRGDVFYGSVHTDPSSYYPHFFGYADETGAFEGDGANLNLPLEPGAEDEAFIDANQRLALAVQAHGAEALVVSAGWDAHRDDPLSKLAVTTDAFPRIGEIWGKLALPTLIVQEGGYSLDALAQAAPAFVAAFRSASGA
jgi:acetoin utilization deacetylase AcuC-like enzyme